MKRTTQMNIVIAGVVFLSLFFPSTSTGQSQWTVDLAASTKNRITGTIRYGHPITILFPISEWKLGEKLTPPTALYLILYEDPLNPPEAIEMKKDNGTWKTEITVTDTSIKMIMFAFQAEDSLHQRFPNLLDTGELDYWDVLMQDDAGNPVRGAHQARALSYTGTGGQRKENLEFALNELQEELTLYPDNYTARNQLYSLQLSMNDYSKDARMEIQKDIESLLQKHPQNTDVMNFAVSAYRMIGETEEAQKIENQIIQQNPKSDQAAIAELNRIVKIENAAERVSELEKFLSEFPHSRVTEFAQSSLASAAIETDDSTQMVIIGDRLLNTSTTPAAASALASLASVFSEKKSELDRAVAYAQKALLLIRTSASMKPPAMSSQEWENRLRTTEARYRDILGWAYFQMGNVQNSLAELKQSAETISQPIVFYHLGQALQKAGDTDEALIQYGRASAFGGDIGDMANGAFSDLWTQSQRNPEEKEAFLETQKTWVEEDYKKKVLALRSIRPAPDFELEDLDGGMVKLSNQKNHVILLCFWASWSQSSQQLLSVLEDLVDIYGKNILFLTVATDIKKADVKSFVKKQHLDLPVLLSENTDRDYGLEGVPTLFLIDGKGNIHFEHKGYRPDMREVLIIEIDDLLEGMEK